MIFSTRGSERTTPTDKREMPEGSSNTSMPIEAEIGSLIYTAVEKGWRRPSQTMLDYMLRGLTIVSMKKPQTKGNIGFSFFDCANRINQEVSMLKSQISQRLESHHGDPDLQGKLTIEKERLEECQTFFIEGYTMNGELMKSEYPHDYYQSNEDHPTKEQHKKQHHVLWQGATICQDAKSVIEEFDKAVPSMKEESDPAIDCGAEAAEDLTEGEDDQGSCWTWE